MRLSRFFPVFGILLNVSVSIAATPDVPQIRWGDIQQGPLIGRDSFGDVYEGRWQGQDVAVKSPH